MTYEADELRRSWKRCSCPIYASGTLAGKFRRGNTEKTIWPEAKPIVENWELGKSWDAPLGYRHAPDPLGPKAELSSPRITIADAIAAFLAIRERDRIVHSTLRKYRTFTKQLVKFAEELPTSANCGEINFLRAKKNGGDVFMWIPDWLRDRLLQRADSMVFSLLFSGSRLASTLLPMDSADALAWCSCWRASTKKL